MALASSSIIQAALRGTRSTAQTLRTPCPVEWVSSRGTKCRAGCAEIEFLSDLSDVLAQGKKAGSLLLEVGFETLIAFLEHG